MNYKSFLDISRDIRNNISKIESGNFDLIVGIPRSGMIPAYMIALYLNKNCCDTASLINNTLLKTGSTRKSKDLITYPSEAKKILLVDDSIMSGKSLADELLKIPESIHSNITTLAIYSSKKVRNDVDLFLEYLPSPRVFEWNIFHHVVIEKSCFDIDGVLCVDPTEEQNDDGEKYIDFIRNAPLLFIPSRKINFLVTNRLEKYRIETEDWLERNGIEYGSLIMLDLPSKKERQQLGVHVNHKAHAYKISGQDLFYESDRNQAVKIHEVTKKPVYCIETNEMFTKGAIISVVYGSSNSRETVLINILNKLPKPIYSNLRLFYRWIRQK